MVHQSDINNFQELFHVAGHQSVHVGHRSTTSKNTTKIKQLDFLVALYLSFIAHLSPI